MVFLLQGVPVPADRVIDGVNMLPVLKGGSSLNNNVFYYRGNGLFAIRFGQYVGLAVS
jgi:arylsulfatase A